MKPMFFICRHCGSIAGLMAKGEPALACCGAPMEPLEAGVTDAAREKHVPVIAVEGSRVTVTVGSVAHPMTEAHLIEWIALETRAGFQRKPLKASSLPQASFALAEGDSVVAAYAYCNLHGLWKASV